MYGGVFTAAYIWISAHVFDDTRVWEWGVGWGMGRGRRSEDGIGVRTCL